MTERISTASSTSNASQPAEPGLTADVRKSDGRAGGPSQPPAENRPATKPRWDPLKSIRMTISPDFRAKLVMMERPLLPAEDFMDTADFELAKAARRRRAPSPLVIVGIGIATLVVIWGIWTWIRFEPSPAAGPTPQAIPSHPHLVEPVSTPKPPANQLATNTPAGAASGVPSAPHASASAIEASRPRSTPTTQLAPAHPAISKKPQPARATATPPSATSPAPEPSDTFWTNPR